MARIKVDNKLNVVVGTKSQILADTSIPENSIIITTDENEQATNIEYDNVASGLEAENVQEAIDETLDLKLDKVFSSLVEQTTINLTDEFVLNRGGVAYRTTLANMLTNVNQGSIFKVVSILPGYPEPADINKIFLVPTSDPEMPNYYEEWIFVYDVAGWEKIGGVSINLDDYYTKNETNTLLGYKQNTLTAGDGISIVGNVISVSNDDYYTKDEIDDMVGDIETALDAILGV